MELLYPQTFTEPTITTYIARPANLMPISIATRLPKLQAWHDIRKEKAKTVKAGELTVGMTFRLYSNRAYRKIVKITPLGQDVSTHRKGKLLIDMECGNYVVADPRAEVSVII